MPTTIHKHPPRPKPIVQKGIEPIELVTPNTPGQITAARATLVRHGALDLADMLGIGGAS